MLDEVNITIDSYIETEKAPNIDLMTLVYTPDNAIVNHVVETYEVLMTLEQVTQVTTGVTLRDLDIHMRSLTLDQERNLTNY